MPPTSAYGWGSGVIDQLSSPPSSNTYMDPETAPEVIVTYQQLDWAIIAVACAAVVALSVFLMVVVSNAEFDDAPPIAPPTSDTCQPFCSGVSGT
ncbi:hypothetical protein [Nocardia sp. NPDC050406]|uniref:hypothetical protein n=1 Tax=Nocardia sp. NPDC050406 TaxID=3364318 RepID=UPI00379FC4A2